MKKLVTAVFLFCGVAFGQTPSSGIYLPQNVTSYGQNIARIKNDSAYLGPTGCGAPSTLRSSNPGMFQHYFDSCNHRFYIYDPKTATWDSVHTGAVSSGSSWSLPGNSGTTAGTNFVGTTDAQDVVFKRNSIEALRLVNRESQTPNIYLNGGYNDSSGVIYADHVGFGKVPFIYTFQKSGTSGDNTFVGLLSGNRTMTGSTGNQGSYNTGFGSATLWNNTTGQKNTAIGTYALQNNTTGYNNTSVGAQSLTSNTTGFNNTAVGIRAIGISNTTGNSNTAIGVDALGFNTTGPFNVSVGIDANYHNTTGGYNTAIGDSTAWIHTIGIKNTFIGSRAGYYLGDTYPNFGSVSDSNCTLIGADTRRDSSISNSVALKNSTALGYGATFYASNQMSFGDENITSNIFRGAFRIKSYGSGAHTGTPTYNLLTDASGNTIEAPIPWTILGNAGTSSSTNFIGTTDNVNLVFKVNNTGSGIIEAGTNTSFGYNSATAVGLRNSAFGSYSLQSNVSGQNNVAIGAYSLNHHKENGSNISIGSDAMHNDSTGYNNTIVGHSALYTNKTGGENTALGYASLYATLNSTGNVAVGASAGKYNTSSGNQLFINNRDQTNYAGDTTNSLVYGKFDPTPTSQRFKINGRLEVVDGTQGNGKVFTSDANGAGSWQTPSGGSIAINTSITSATAGSILFAGTGGTLQQINSKLFYDSANAMLGMGNSAPSSTLHVTGTFSLSVMAEFVALGDDDNYIINDNPGFSYCIKYSGSGTATVSLPDAGTCVGRIYSIRRNADVSSGILSVYPVGCNIEDKTGSLNSTYTLLNLDKMMWQSNGTDWVLIMSN